MTRDEIVQQMIDGYAKWQALLAEIDEERMTTPGVSGEWSIKDIVAHVSVYEGWTAEFIRLKTWPPLPDHLNLIDTDQRNEAFYLDRRDWSLADVLAEADRAHNAFVEAVKGLSDEEFADQTLLGMPQEEGWEATSLIPEGTFRHYEHHATAIRAWLAGQE